MMQMKVKTVALQRLLLLLLLLAVIGSRIVSLCRSVYSIGMIASRLLDDLFTGTKK